MNYSFSSLGYSDFEEETDYFKLNFDINNYKWGSDIIKQEEKERKEREKKRYDEQVKIIEVQIEEAKELKRQINEKNIKDYIEINGTNLWKAGNDYPNIFVPLSVINIVALDKVNNITLWLGKNGTNNKMESLLRPSNDIEPYTINEYYQTFCTKVLINNDIQYIYTKDVDLNEKVTFTNDNGDVISEEIQNLIIED